MLKKSSLLLALVSMLLVPGAYAIPAQAQANTPGQTTPNRSNRPNRPNLNLTPEQATQMQAIREKYKGQISQTREQLQQARTELRQLMVNGASQTQAQPKFQQVQQLQNKMAELRFQSMMEINAILTPTQRQQLASQMEQRQGVKRPQRQGQPNSGI